MPPFATEAIILSTRDFQERDILITFYGDEKGKLRGVAKGAKASKRRFGANLDLLSRVRIHGLEKRGSSLVIVQLVDLLEHFSALREDLDFFARACYVAEWADGCLPERQPIKGFMELLLWTVRSLSKRREREETLRLFELKSLVLAGYGPRLERCVKCGKEAQEMERIEVDVASGGIVCGECSKGASLRLTPGTLKLLKEARDLPVERAHRLRFSRLSLKESKTLLRNFYAHYVGHRLHSVDFLDRHCALTA